MKKYFFPLYGDRIFVANFIAKLLILLKNKAKKIFHKNKIKKNYLSHK